MSARTEAERLGVSAEEYAAAEAARARHDAKQADERTIAELRKEHRLPAIRRAIQLAQVADDAARRTWGNSDNDTEVATACGAGAQAWAAVAALLKPNGAVD